jgi:hypothetical protein
MEPDDIVHDVVPERRGVFEAGVDELEAWGAAGWRRLLVNGLTRRHCGQRGNQDHDRTGASSRGASL